MSARDWLTLFIAYEGAPEGLDPVRLQKGLFLFSEEAGVSPKERYTFVPYNYGPMSREIYSDLDQLAGEGLVEAVPVKGQSWCRYVPTDEGLEYARKHLANANPRATEHLFRIKQEVAAMRFDQLLEDVYERYPDYAKNSVFQRRG